MFNLFNKQKHFFDSWTSGPTRKESLIPELGSLGTLKLGDRVDLIEPFGKPNSFKQSEKNYYTLEYNNLTFDCEDGFITYIGCTFGEIELQTADNRKIEKGMSIDQVMELAGAPDEDDIDELDDVVLTYTKKDITIEFEFGSSRELVRVNCFRNEET